MCVCTLRHSSTPTTRTCAGSTPAKYFLNFSQLSSPWFSSLSNMSPRTVGLPHMTGSASSVLRLSLAVILIVIWGHMARWTDQIEKKRELSHRCRELVTEHSSLRDTRPVAQSKLRKWLSECELFEDFRKHELATVPPGCLQGGHQHVGNTHVKDGVQCKKCNRSKWTQEMNRITWSKRLFSQKCDACRCLMIRRTVDLAEQLLRQVPQDEMGDLIRLLLVLQLELQRCR